MLPQSLLLRDPPEDAASSPAGSGPSRVDLHRDTNPALVEFSDVCKVYKARGSETVGALDRISFDVRKGEIFGIIGRSGAGKSTLIRLVNGLERSTSGRVSVDGLDIASLSSSNLTALRRRTGMIFQGFNLMSSRTVLDNVALPLRLADTAKREARGLALNALDLVGLSDKAGAYPSRLSGGQRQRAGIARAIVQNPVLLLSDEATSALDPETTSSILALLRDINRRLGLTIILITHEMEVIRQVADRVAVLERGRIVESGPVGAVFGNPQHAATSALLRQEDYGLQDRLAANPCEVLFEIDLSRPDHGDPDLFAIVTAIGPGARLGSGLID